MDTRIDRLLDSDMSSELILTKMLNEEKSILTPSWIYSTELRVLNTQLVFAPLFSLFEDLHAVRITGSVILYRIMLLYYAYLCHQIRIRHLFAWTAPFLLLPVSDDYLQFVLEGVYYIPHISISFVSLGLVLGIIRCKEKLQTVDCSRTVVFDRWNGGTSATDDSLYSSAANGVHSLSAGGEGALETCRRGRIFSLLAETSLVFSRGGSVLWSRLFGK